jgi:hypothetical protein
MARRRDITDNSSWPYAEELLERGDPAFVDEFRRLTDADRLGNFAARWYLDRRPASRRLLLEYLGRPLNAFRHEALVKRLFKLAEQAGDDEVMGHFLVQLDRSVRRVKRKRHHHESVSVPTREAAQEVQARWTQQGFESTNVYGQGKGMRVYGRWTEDVLAVPSGTTMWRPTGDGLHRPHPIDEKTRQQYERCRLFSLSTRKYLRRRAWRYFRRLGKQHPERYIPAVSAALKHYENEDATTGLALLDNWGLVHILFHHCPALESPASGWTLDEGHTLAELTPAPIYPALWQQALRALVVLLTGARCRPVRQWAVQMIRRNHEALLAGLGLDEVFGFLAHEDPEVVALGAEVLRSSRDLDALNADRWLALLDTPRPQTLEILCELIAAHLKPERVSLEQAVRLASSRPLPVARLGFSWLRAKRHESEADCRALLGLADAQAEPLRAELAGWARGVLSAAPHFQADWLLEYLDSKHPEIRAEGWKWLREEPRARDDVGLWRRLLESPYDDVRLLLVADLEERVSGRDPARAAQGRLDEELLRFLWASVLLNVHRGGRVKPLVVGQLVRRLEQRPAEAPALLPILSVALRSLRGPEWRAGLAGVVGLAERKPDLIPLVGELFPELKLL